MSADATTALLRAIEASFAAIADFTVEEIRSRSWVSGTFVGARHELAFRLAGDAAAPLADAFLDGLEEREFDLRGHLLADIRLVAREALAGGVMVRLEALTIESDQA